MIEMKIGSANPYLTNDQSRDSLKLPPHRHMTVKKYLLDIWIDEAHQERFEREKRSF